MKCVQQIHPVKLSNVEYRLDRPLIEDFKIQKYDSISIEIPEHFEVGKNYCAICEGEIPKGENGCGYTINLKKIEGS